MTGRLAAAWRALVRPRPDGKVAMLTAADATAAQLPPHELLRLARAVDVVDVPSGGVLVAAGDHGDWHHHVLDGQVAYLQDNGTATLLGPGAVCVTSDGDTVTAMTACRVAVTRADVADELRPLAPTLLAAPAASTGAAPRPRRPAGGKVHVDAQ